MSMEYIDSIITTTINSFDFGLVLVINLVTYFVIKLSEEITTHKLSKWIKRFITIFSAISVGIIYGFIDGEISKLLLNSMILSPVSWDWIFKPVVNKFRLDYKVDDNL